MTVVTPTGTPTISAPATTPPADVPAAGAVPGGSNRPGGGGGALAFWSGLAAVGAATWAHALS